MIQLKNITKSFDLNKNKVEVLKGINLEIGDDEFIALMGPSGSGKSTLLGILAGIDSPTSGDIFIYGQDISKKKEDELARFRNKNVGIIFQAYNLIPSLNAIQNVKAPLYAGKNKLSSKEIDQRAKELLKHMQKFEGVESDEMAQGIKEDARADDIINYEGLAAGPEVNTSKEIIVVEGRADVLKLLGYGIKNAIAMNGANITAELKVLLPVRIIIFPSKRGVSILFSFKEPIC